jgi:hypothetical protein
MPWLSDPFIQTKAIPDPAAKKIPVAAAAAKAKPDPKVTPDPAAKATKTKGKAPKK